MEFEQFAAAHRAGRATARVDRRLAMLVCDRSAALPLASRVVHYTWKWLAFVAVCTGLVCVLQGLWLPGLVALAAGIALGVAVQWLAARAVLRHALRDAGFLERMHAAGVIEIRALDAPGQMVGAAR